MAGRSSDRPEEQDYKALGKTGNAPLSTQGSAYALSLYIRCHLPGPGCRRGSGASPAAMNLHLLEISAAVAPGAHAVVIVDQAGWHFAKALVIPHNITLIVLPPKSPELNPVENIWQFMRDNWLSNRIFKSYNDILDYCCFAWNQLIDQPWNIMSIGHREWAHR